MEIFIFPMILFVLLLLAWCYTLHTQIENLEKKLNQKILHDIERGYYEGKE